MTDGTFPFPTPTRSYLELEPRQALNLLVPVIKPLIFVIAEEELSCFLPSTRGQGERETPCHRGVLKPQWGAGAAGAPSFSVQHPTRAPCG